jgi:hypothetical protein
VGLGVGGAAEIHLLGAEQDDTGRAAGSLRQAGDQPGGAEDDGDAGAVIGGAGAEIPGIEMSTDKNDLIRTLCTLPRASVAAMALTEISAKWRTYGAILFPPSITIDGD